MADGFVARPIFHGMLLFAEAGPGHLIDARIDDQDKAPLLTAFGIVGEAGEAGVKAVVFNKHDDRAVELAIAGGERATHARVLRLTAPRLDDTTDVTLGANPVGESGTWEKSRVDETPVRNGTATVDMPPGSAALVSFQIGG